jgi:nucleoid-associated protein YgaU
MVVGAVMLSNYDQMKNMQNTLNTLTDNFKQVESVFLRNENQKAITNMDDQMPDIAKETSINDTKDSEDSEKSLNVEVVPGGVTPLVKNDNEGENSYEEQANTESMAQNPDISVNNEEEDEDHETLGEQDAETNAPVEVKYYTVKAGDSLAGISYRLYSSANYISIIKNLNNIEDEDMIYIGQKLILP